MSPSTSESVSTLSLCTVGLMLFAIVIGSGSWAAAQSGTRQPPRSYAPPQGSDTRPQGSNARPAPGNANAALQGFCPVCIIDMQKWVRGVAQHQTTYDGKTYYFPGDNQKQTFLSDPAKYVPALGGDSPVSIIDSGRRLPGSVHHAAFRDGRLFLFGDDNQKRQFLANPEKYVNADLAFGGECAVSRVDQNKQVPGKPEVTAYHQGLRYLFSTDAQRKAFLANPARYAVKAAGAPAAR